MFDGRRRLSQKQHANGVARWLVELTDARAFRRNALDNKPLNSGCRIRSRGLGRLPLLRYGAGIVQTSREPALRIEQIAIGARIREPDDGPRRPVPPQIPSGSIVEGRQSHQSDIMMPGRHVHVQSLHDDNDCTTLSDHLSG